MKRLLPIIGAIIMLLAFTGCNSTSTTDTEQTVEKPYDYRELNYAVVTFQSNFDAYGGYSNLKIRIANTGNIVTSGYMIIHYVDGIAYDVYTPKPTYDSDFIYVDVPIIIPRNDTGEDIEHQVLAKFFLDGVPKQLDRITIYQTWVDLTENIIIQNDVNVTINDDEYIEIPVEINVTTPPPTVYFIPEDENATDENVTDANVSQ